MVTIDYPEPSLKKWDCATIPQIKVSGLGDYYLEVARLVLDRAILNVFFDGHSILIPESEAIFILEIIDRYRSATIERVSGSAAAKGIASVAVVTVPLPEMPSHAPRFFRPSAGPLTKAALIVPTRKDPALLKPRVSSR